MPRARWSASGSFPTRTATANARSPSGSTRRRPAARSRFASACATAFPDLRATAAWQLARDDSLRLVDKQGTVLLELNEVEAGMYETTPSHTHYFLQTLAAINKERITDDLFGDWQFTRGTARVICQMTLGNTAHDTDSFVLTLKPGCDPLIARFAPVSWRLDRGQFVMLSAAGQSWRFEESENVWSRIPAMRPPLVMARPPQ